MNAKRLTIRLLLLLTVFSLTQCTQKDSFYSNVLRSDVFVQAYSSDKYDFLWVMDNSASMSDKRAYVRDEINTFLTILNSRKAIDYRMSMTTTDFFSHAGALVQGPGALEVVSSLAVDPVADFGSIIDNVADTATSFWEQGLESAYQAIANQGPTFMRANTPLIIIFLTDEEDYSCESSCSGIEPENNPDDVPFATSRYITYYGAAATDVTIFPIVGTTASQCVLPSNGDRYAEIQEAIGGTTGSICLADLPTTYQTIAQTIADRGVAFKLSSTSSGTGISVFVDRVEVPYSASDGFIFESSSNSIVFTGNSVPVSGAVIEVVYAEQQT